MKKVIIIIVAVVVVVGAVAAFFLLAKPGSSSDSSASKAGQLPTASVKACDVLTKSVATSLLGDGAILPAGGVVTQSSADISESSCMYVITNGNTAKNALAGSGVQLYARVAKTEAGASSNKQSFTTVPSGSQAVSGVGDKAFYNPQFKQLNVLKGDNWYLATYYVGDLSNATLDTDKQFVQKLVLQ